MTNGGNQAFVNLVLALVDEGDAVVLFKPAYFDHIMTVQMTGGARTLLFGDCDAATLKPSAAWLRQALARQRPREAEAPTSGSVGGASRPRVKMVAIVNPCNPTGERGRKGMRLPNHLSGNITAIFYFSPGVLLTKSELQEIADTCAEANCWLVRGGFYSSASFPQPTRIKRLDSV